MRNLSQSTIRVLIVCAVVGTMLFISPDNVFAATSKKTYYVTVEYIDCYDNNGNPTGEQSRTETWRKNGNGAPLYQEHRSCSGETTTSGKKPLGGGGGGWYKLASETNYDEVEFSTFHFNLLPGNNLQVKASTNTKCDIYELGTGKLLLKDIDVAGSNSYQSIPVVPSNTPYLIQFKVDGNIVSQQTIIFNSSTNLLTGGANE
ncbi:MAG: hypothetical protein FWG85_06750 [Bacteroidetes bacterium]|nr:hypothetical protein [Bacteroidota bacterium]